MDMSYPENSQTIILQEDLTPLRKMFFKDVTEIWDWCLEYFAPKNIKLISKWAERIYGNGYCVFILYCNRCQKRKPTYQCKRRYKKWSTNCPFRLKFTWNESEKYALTGGEFYHNHTYNSPVLDSQILEEIDWNFNVQNAKPSEVVKFIKQKYEKEITYPQIAYELNKWKNILLGWTKTDL